MASILIFVDYQDHNNILRKALEPAHLLFFANKLDDALQVLYTCKFDLIISRVFLKEQCMFDLLNAVKSSPQLKDIPFVCFVGVQSRIARASTHWLRSMAKSLGADGYVELEEFSRAGTCDYKRLRETLERFLPSRSQSVS